MPRSSPKEFDMDLMIIPVLLALLLAAYLIYRAYAARMRGKKAPDEDI